MASCLLSDVPVAPFQVVLQHLNSYDWGSLRLVSNSVSKRTTQNIPYIILRLSEFSDADQLQQWCQATRHLQQCTSTHVHVTGKVTAQVFEQAMELLSENMHIRELQLLAVGASRGSQDTSARITSFLPSLQPLQHLINNLRTLVIEGIALNDMEGDLQQLAAAAAAARGFQLQTLTLNVFWSHTVNHSFSMTRTAPCPQPSFSSAMVHMTKAFPHLKQWMIRMPEIGMVAPGERAQHILYASEFLTVGSNVTGQNTQRTAATALVAAFTGLVDAAMQLKSLELLTVTNVADVWKHRSVELLNAVFSQDASTGVTSAVAEPATNTSAQAGGLLAAGLHTTEAAAVATSMLDECGCWLLQQHPKLAAAHICTADRGLGMSWKQQQQQPYLSFNSDRLAKDKPAVAADIFSADSCVDAYLDLRWESNESSMVPLDNYSGSSGSISSSSNSSSSSSSNPWSLLSRCTRQLCHYSSRPPSSLIRHIRSCRLDLYSTMCCFHNLAGLLRDLESLKHLQISVKQVSIGPTEAEAAVAVMTAAAAVPGLQSLSMTMLASATVHLPHDLLLPLTAAAGGPGSSLRRLKLAGKFSASSASDTAWLSMLQQLDGLLELSIQQFRGNPLSVSVDSLPASLEVFDGQTLDLFSGDAVLAAVADVVVTGHGGSQQHIKTDKPCRHPQLHRLQLNGCKLSSPSILASHQLQQLTVAFTSWSGGWAAAAAAWPSVRELVWRYDNRLSRCNNISSSSLHSRGNEDSFAPLLIGESMTAHTVLRDLSLAFSALTSLTVCDIPWLPVTTLNKMVLQPLVQHTRELRHIDIRVPRQPLYASDLLRALSDEAEARTGMCCGSSNRDADPRVYQQWVQHHLPWASVIVSSN